MATTQKIRYSDCDPQGIVFNGNYSRYWDDALTDWFEDLGLGGAELGGSGVDVVTARLEMDFRASASLGDTVVTSIQVDRLGTSSMSAGFETIRQSDGLVVVEGKEVLVFVDPVSFRPTAIPSHIRAMLDGNPATEQNVEPKDE